MGHRTGPAGAAAVLTGLVLAAVGAGATTTAGLVLVAAGTYALVLPRVLQPRGV